MEGSSAGLLYHGINIYEGSSAGLLYHGVNIYGGEFSRSFILRSKYIWRGNLALQTVRHCN